MRITHSRLVRLIREELSLSLNRIDEGVGALSRVIRDFSDMVVTPNDRDSDLSVILNDLHHGDQLDSSDPYAGWASGSIAGYASEWGIESADDVSDLLSDIDEMGLPLDLGPLSGVISDFPSMDFLQAIGDIIKEFSGSTQRSSDDLSTDPECFLTAGPNSYYDCNPRPGYDCTSTVAGSDSKCYVWKSKATNNDGEYDIIEVPSGEPRWTRYFVNDL